MLKKKFKMKYIIKQRNELEIESWLNLPMHAKVLLHDKLSWSFIEIGGRDTPYASLSAHPCSCTFFLLRKLTKAAFSAK